MDIETDIVIAASPTRVWAVLTDFPLYGDWNPFITAIAGPLGPGARLEVRIQPPGQRAMHFRPRLLPVMPHRELRWKGQVLLPGLFDGEHRFLLEPLEDGAKTRLHHGERFSGLLVGPLFGSKMLAATRAGFIAMNEALKRRAEGMAS